MIVTFQAQCDRCLALAFWTSWPSGTGNAKPEVDCPRCDHPRSRVIPLRKSTF